MDLVRGDKKVIRVAAETEKGGRDTGGNGGLKRRRDNVDVSLNGCETGEDTMKLLVSAAAFGRRGFNMSHKKCPSERSHKQTCLRSIEEEST